MKAIMQAAEVIGKARALIITAGAGMGVDSGLPDFRGDEGFWAYYPSLYGHSFSDMANPKWFEEDPFLAWGFYGHRLNLYRETVPHVGFSILHRWASSLPHFIFTSNVDAQFQKAGFSEEKVVECHGSIHWMQYLYGDGNEIWDGSSVEIQVDKEFLRASGTLPMRNNQIIRPNILMFGDWNWLEGRTEQQVERFQQWIAQQQKSTLSEESILDGVVVVELGAGTAIPTVRSQGEFMQREGATLVRINPREAHGPRGTISIPMGAKEGLEQIDAVLA